MIVVVKNPTEIIAKLEKYPRVTQFLLLLL